MNKSMLNCGSGLNLEFGKACASLTCECQGQSGGVRASLGCQGQQGRAKASLKCQHQFGPESVCNASASLEYQGTSEVRRPIWDANTSLGCPRQFEVPGLIWDARANVKCVLHQVCYQVTYATRCVVPRCCKATRSALVVLIWIRLENTFLKSF